LAMKVNLLPAKVNLSASAPVNFSKPHLPPWDWKNHHCNRNETSYYHGF
jgi:hypothetical protein